MSIMRLANIKCPKCGRECPTAVWDSLNVHLSPEARTKLLAGEINLFRCISCGYEGLLSVPLLYHDMKNEFCVQFFPFNDIEKSEFLYSFSRDGEMAVDLNGAPDDVPTYFKRVHTVFGMDELVRYVIFRERLAERYSTEEKAS